MAGLSVAALLLGPTGFIPGGFTHGALTRIRRDGTDGRGMAVGGLVLGTAGWCGRRRPPGRTGCAR
ncbi:unnamed protein product [[Actinomadura] parvosata subsp. kistnae]|nr:unnamed protein product [Actinomadura parvosata subsp. kistnae]